MDVDVVVQCLIRNLHIIHKEIHSFGMHHCWYTICYYGFAIFFFLITILNYEYPIRYFTNIHTVSHPIITDLQSVIIDSYQQLRISTMLFTYSHTFNNYVQSVVRKRMLLWVHKHSFKSRCYRLTTSCEGFKNRFTIHF